MKVNVKYVQTMCIIALIALVGCSNADPETTARLTGPYPELYEAVFERDGEALLAFTDHSDSVVSAQAWNALISTPFDDVSGLMDAAAAANTPSSWASLWFKELTEQQVGKLEEQWRSDSSLREGIAGVLGYHGDEQTLNMFLDEGPDDFPTALAIGRIAGRIELNAEQEMAIAKRAFGAESEPSKVQAYLYGFYRSSKDLRPETRSFMLEAWDNFYPEGNAAEQYLARILMKDHMDEVIFRYEMDDYEYMDPILAIEFARNIARFPLTRQSAAVLNALLDNRNVNVRMEALKAIEAQQETLEGRHDRAVLNKLGLIRGYQAPLRMQALAAVSDASRYNELVIELASEDPFLQELRYRIQQRYLNSDSLLAQMVVTLESEDRLMRLFTFQALVSWWQQLDEGQKTDLAPSIQELLTDIMQTGDRTFVFAMRPLLKDPRLVPDHRFDLIEDMMDRFNLPEDVEVFQAMSGLLKERFPEEGSGLIQQLAAEGNTALNATLAADGWEVEAGEAAIPDFRMPDWKKMTRLGDDPILVMDTEKGIIRMRLNTLEAPATIAGMDSLIRDGAYNYIPFHRVIPNFVAQGGDVESQDGLGGPDYIVPTEATPRQYERGMVGIASAGTDTEGSQFFIMYDWMPHLNGRYTIIGEVIEGMDVVDRMVQGDYVKRVRWQ